MSSVRVYTADFETANADENIIDRYTHVWLWDICDITDMSHINGDNIDDFIVKSSELGGIFYFHNEKFDGSFIIYRLLQLGYNFTDERKLEDNEFSCLVTDRGIFYTIRYRVEGGNIAEIRDSSKKIPGTVKEIAEDYNLPIRKGDINYRARRVPRGAVSAEDLAYIHNDTEIIAYVIRDQYEHDMTRVTTSSDTFNLYKKSLGHSFRRIFPEFKYEEDCYFRRAYRGGVVQVVDNYVDKSISNVLCYDVNSMYPSIMVNEVLPYGRPIFFEGKPKNYVSLPLYILRVEVDIRLRDGHRPTILQKSFGFKKVEYIIDTQGEMVELTLTNVDFELMQEHYIVNDIIYKDGYYFRGSRNLFKDYILPLYKIKSTSKGSEKIRAKLLMNGLYGKFAMSPKRIKMRPFINDKGALQFKGYAEDIDEPIYTPVAAFITSYARRKLFRAIHDNIDAFVYCDTDSIHLLEPARGILVDKTVLGAWDLEKIYVKARYLAQKTYYGIKDNGEHDIKACGCPKKSKELFTWKNFHFGTTVGGKLAQKRVRGGVILEDTTFTLKPRD